MANQISAEQGKQLYQNSTAQNQTMRTLYNGQTPNGSGTSSGGTSQSSYGGPSQEEIEEAKRKAEEKEKEEEEKKKKEKQEKEDRWNSALADIEQSGSKADLMTEKQAISDDTSGSLLGTGYSKSRMAGMSSADDAYTAADYITANKVQNRNTAFNQAVKSGEELLKAFGIEDTEAYNKEAGTLQEQAESQTNLANIFSTLTNAINSYKNF